MIKGVYSDKVKKEPPNREGWLTLSENDTRVTLALVDKYGHCVSNLLSIHKETGYVTFYGDISEAYGFELNSVGQLILI